MTVRWLSFILATALLGYLEPLRAQQAVSRRGIIAAALTRGPLVALFAADTSRAVAELATARVLFQPLLQTSYTTSSPQYHVIAELPLDGVLLRGRRLAVGRATLRSAKAQYLFNRASIVFDADTAYTRAIAATARAALSRRTAIDADSLRIIAAARRDAGDASELDVQLAIISAGQQANLAALDSVAAIARLLDLQSLIGLSADSVRIVLADSLTLPPTDRTIPPRGTPLRIVAASSNVDASTARVALERRSRFGSPSLTAGVEKGDPTGAQTQALPTVGISLPIPFPGRNRGVVRVAEAERSRAVAALAVVTLESSRQVSRARRELVAAAARVQRTSGLLAGAERVAALALTAYREGASPLPSVLEARRNARDILTQYIDDLTALWTALAAETLVTSTGGS